MLGGNGVPGNLPQEITGIPVNTKADALFFLHTARIDRRLDDRERGEKKRFELCRYVIRYADGQTAEVPVYSEIDVDHFRQKEPKALPGAQLALRPLAANAGQWQSHQLRQGRL
jgi:beta-galactosidase